MGAAARRAIEKSSALSVKIFGDGKIAARRAASKVPPVERRFQ